ncbi:MAG TPA: sulfite reductase subunit alpha [Dokdonella sp.]
MSARGGFLARPSASALGNALALLALAALAGGLLHLHGGWPGWPEPSPRRTAAAAVVALAYLGFCAALVLRRRMHAPPRRRADDAGAAAVLIVAYASQTGFAEQLARQTERSLADAGVPVRLAPLAALDDAALAAALRLLIVASTTGEGDAPDGAAPFERRMQSAPPELARLRYGVLALGDREYDDFCAFGHRIDAWLRRGSAQPLFDLVEVDDGDEGALRHWQHHLGLLAGTPDLPDWSPPHYRRWRLVERRLLNPGGVGGACFDLALQPADGALPGWRAGDIAEIGPRNAPADVARALAATGFDGAALVDVGRGAEPLGDVLARSRLPAADEAPAADAQAFAERLRALPHREYSIASIPAEGAIHLLVRQLRRPDGSLGVGAGWLTVHAPLGGDVALRIRANANFRAPDDDRPLILIGNGTGIAGLRALLAERVAASRRRNWLVFGERNAAHDFHYRDDVERWRAQGFLERLDLAFSRDQAERIYVQHRLREAAAPLREWVAAGAAIYVCGSLEGMAGAIDATLADLLGRDALAALAASGHYRRDVY